MKCLKYQYISPLYGSVQCDDVNPEYDDGYRFAPETMLTLFNRNKCIQTFLDNNVEDLSNYVPDQLKEVVVKAVFGRTAAMDSKLYLLTEIYTTRDLDALEEELVREWITGQMSDGWGESLEQREATYEMVRVNRPYFEEERAMFVDNEGSAEVGYYLNPWNNENWSVEFLDKEYEEVDVEAQSLNLEVRLQVKEAEIKQLKEEAKQLTTKLKELSTQLVELVEKVNKL